MSNYTKTTDFEAKDSLPSGDSGKIIRGSEFETEFDNIATAIASKSDANNPTFTGTVTIDGLTVNGNTVLGNAATDTVTVTADIASNLLPSADDTYNLGAVGAEWNDLFIDGVANIDSLVANTADINGGTVDGVTIGGSSAGAITGTTITGTSFVTSGNMTFGDNDKAVFGAGSDLEIYHDGSHSYIDDSGTGDLRIRGTNLSLRSKATNERFLDGVENGAVTIYHDNATKLATSATGIDVTGTVTADGLTVDGTGTITNSSAGVATALSLKNNTAGANNRTAIDLFSANTKYVTLEGGYGASSPTFNLKVGNPPKLAMSADGNGDISFYEDTGTTAKMFWDASAESLGLGTSSPSSKLQVMGGTSGLDQISLSSNLTNNNIKYAGIVMTNYGNTTTALLGGKAQNGTTSVYYGSSGSDHRGPQNHIFYTNASATATSGNTERMRIESSGEVGIGTSDPTAFIHAEGTGVGTETYAKFSTGPAAGDQILSVKSSSARNHMALQVNAGGGAVDDLALNPDGGNVGIGTSSPSTTLEVANSTPVLRLTNTQNLGNGQWDQVSMGAVQFYTSDTTSPGARVGAEIEAFSEDGASGPEFELVFKTSSVSESATERLRIDSSGNLLVGTTSTTPQTGDHGFVARANGYTIASMDDARAMLLNRATSDGEILNFRKDGTTVGSIGSFSGVVSYIALDPRTSGVNGAGLMGGSLSQTEGIIQPTNGAGAKDDDAINLGASNNRFKDIYATNGTIQTSDRNEKQDIEELSEAEQRVAVACKGLLRKFRWKSAVEEKGDDARIHFGIIAQDLQDAFTAEGLDAGRYAMFINSTWTDEETGEERSRMGVRYSELLAFIISAI